MPNSKAAKFVAANPLAPMADPFSGMVSFDFDFRNNKSIIEFEYRISN